MPNKRTGPDFLEESKKYRKESIEGWKKMFTPMKGQKSKKKKKSNG